MTALRVPHLVQCYWVLPGQLLAGEYPAHIQADDAYARLDALLEAGIDTFFNLTQAGELPPYLPMLEQRAARRGVQITHDRYPIVDFGLPSPADMLATLNAIDAALQDGRRVYLHCWGGVGRTGLTVGCFLVRHGLTGQEALDQLAEWWQGIPKRQHHPRTPETDDQVRFVLDWREPGAGTQA